MIKCDYIISNTLAIKAKVADVIFYDLLQRNGKYKYEYPQTIFTHLDTSASSVVENTAYIVVEPITLKEEISANLNIGASFLVETEAPIYSVVAE